MRGTWRLRGPFGVILLGRPGDLPTSGSGRLPPVAFVRAILRRAADEPSARRELQNLHDALLGRPSSSRSSRTNEDDFRRIATRIERAILAGELVMKEERASAGGLPNEDIGGPEPAGDLAPLDAPLGPSIIALKRVRRTGELESIRVCAPLRVQAVTNSATGADLSSIIWTVRIDGAVVSHPSIRTKDDKLKILRVPDEWFGKRLEIAASLPGQTSVALNPDGPGVVPSQSEVAEYIGLVRKVEVATGWAPEDVLSALRRLAGVGDAHFQDAILGSPMPLPADLADLVNHGQLAGVTLNDVRRLKALSAHGVTKNEQGGATGEVGVASDMLGSTVALGHVLAGMAAGMHFSSTTGIHILGVLTGVACSNLDFVTIAGDLGQTTVTFTCDHTNFPVRVGALESEASDAELVGDLDGVVLGKLVTSAGLPSVSQVLHDYYCVRANDHRTPLSSERVRLFRSLMPANLATEALNFAQVYQAKEYPFHPLVDASDVAPTIADFMSWLTLQENIEVSRRTTAEAADATDAAEGGWPSP